MSDKLFSDLGLSAESLQAIARLGFEQPSPIQAEAIPPLLAGHDVVGQSQTGSGKTAAFALPAIERIDPTNRSVQVLILCNTRELAIQVSEEIFKLAHFKPGVRPLPIYGGQSYDRQISGLRSGANLVIGTPGRVMDHMQRGTLVLNQVKMVVLDEADEMLNMGFRDDMEFILKAVPAERQTVLFSATIPRPIEELIARYTRTPQRVQIQSKAMTVPTVDQAYVEVDRRWKVEALERLIDLHDVTRGLVFCNTQRMVDELTEMLNAAGYGADSIHGGMAQAQRDRVMKKFKGGGLEFLVATDVAARGIDVEDIQVVFNFDMPYDGEDYVHRIGRTGRAGRKGLAISFASGRERFVIQQIERFTRQRLRRIDVPSPNEIEEARLNQLMQSVRATIEAGNFRHYDHLIEGLLEDGIDSLDLANALLHQLRGAAGENAANSNDRKPAKPAKAPVKPVVPAGDRPVAIAPPIAAPVVPSSTAPVPASPAPTIAAEPVAAAPVAAVVAPAPTPAAVPAPAPAVKPKPAVRPPAVTPPVAAAPAPAAPATPAAPARKPLLSIPPPPPAALRERAERESREPRSAPGFPRPGRPAPAFDRPPAANRFDRPQHDDRQERPVRRAEGAPPAGPEERTSRRPEREPAPAAQNRPRTAARPRPGPEMTRLWIGVGSENNVAPGDIKGCVLGETGVPAESVGNIDIRERHSFVDVASEAAAGIIAKLNRANLGGQRLKAKVA